MRPARGLTVLTGGARSGKSDLAVRWGRAWDGAVVFVATATAGDDDMSQRIERHRADRPEGWSLVESALAAPADLAAVEPDALCIIDCLTMLVANMVFDGRPDDDILVEVRRLTDWIAGRTGPTILVTNEVGLGVHPPTELGRRYRDVLGRANRLVTDRSDCTYLVVSGQLLPLTEPALAW